MNYEIFFPNLKVEITKDNYPKLFNFLKEFKELSSNYFDCEFENDICKRYRLFGCCSSCMASYGFYRYDSFILGTKEEIVSYFSFERDNYRFGFLNVYGGGKGCSLPRYLRSNPCNIFKCYGQDNIEIRKITLKYDELISSINKYFEIQDNLNKTELEILNDLKRDHSDYLDFFKMGK